LTTELVEPPPCDDKKRRGAVRWSASGQNVDFQAVTAYLQRAGYNHTREIANGVEIPETQPLVLTHKQNERESSGWTVEVQVPVGKSR
jgi:hypothetical protein